MAQTFVDVIGVKGCAPVISNLTPAVVSCPTVAPGSTGGFGSANFNALGASASSTALTNVTSVAQFTDTVTFSPPGAGPGFVGVGEVINGTITLGGIGSSAFGSFSVSFNDTQLCIAKLNIEGSNGTDCIAFFPVTLGVTQQLTIFGSLQVNAKFGAFADFSHTAKIANINLYDANMNLIGPVDLIGASGTVYGSVPPAVPEPSSLLLFASGLLGLASKARTKWFS